jgi:hypothetical protein
MSIELDRPGRGVAAFMLTVGMPLAERAILFERPRMSWPRSWNNPWPGKIVLQVAA